MNVDEDWAVLECDGPSRTVWEELLRRWPQREVFADPAYLSLYRDEAQRPLGLLYRSASGVVLHPVMSRDISGTSAGVVGGTDLSSPPFGYGGPFVLALNAAADRGQLLRSFYEQFRTWAEQEGVVAEYTLFSPITGPPGEYPGATVERMPSIVRGLDLPAQALWDDYDRSVRKGIASARRQGVSVTVDLDGEHSEAFLRIHHTILDRRGGGIRGHRLTPDFVNAMQSSLSGQFVYFHAWHEGELVGSDLCLLSARTALAFRGGIHPDRYSTRASALLTHESFGWCQTSGRVSYILGGGVAGFDSVFRHKRYFAPNGARPLRAGHWVLDHDRYHNLVTQRRDREASAGRSWPTAEDYFPRYRSP